jgi:hypothetical protein
MLGFANILLSIYLYIKYLSAVFYSFFNHLFYSPKLTKNQHLRNIQVTANLCLRERYADHVHLSYEEHTKLRSRLSYFTLVHISATSFFKL